MIGCFLQMGKSHCFICHMDYENEHECGNNTGTSPIGYCQKCDDWRLKGATSKNYKYCPHCGKEL